MLINRRIQLAFFTTAIVLLGSFIIYNDKKVETNNSVNQLSKVEKKELQTTTSKNVEQTINTNSSALKKNETESEVKELSFKEELLEKVLVSVKKHNFNKNFELAFQNVLNRKENKNKKEEALKFIQNYPFESEIKDALSALSEDQLQALVEISDHPTSKKLQENTAEVQKKAIEYIQENKEYTVAEEKKELINNILIESDLVERAQQSSKGIVETTIAYQLRQKNEKLSLNEAMAQAKDQTAKYLKGNEANIIKALNITYDTVDVQNLQEHLRLLQRTNAKKAYEASTSAYDKVYNKFIKEFLEIL